MAGGISVHAVDVAAGVPAGGLQVDIFRLEPDDSRPLVASGRLQASGALAHPVTDGVGVQTGEHEVHFHLGDWWRERGGTEAPYFQEVAVFRFRLTQLEQHYHLPIKFTPWGFALFRGA